MYCGGHNFLCRPLLYSRNSDARGLHWITYPHKMYCPCTQEVVVTDVMPEIYLLETYCVKSDGAFSLAARAILVAAVLSRDRAHSARHESTQISLLKQTQLLCAVPRHHACTCCLTSQAMYSVVHGGIDVELRRRSIEYLSALPFDGTAIGGSMGKSKVRTLPQRQTRSRLLQIGS